MQLAQDILDNLLIIQDKTLESIQSRALLPTLGYFAICLLIAFILLFTALFIVYGRFEMLPANLSLEFAIIDSLASILLMLLMFLAYVLLIHVFALLMGARKSLQTTLSLHIYAYTPAFLLGWIYSFGSTDSPFGIIILFAGLLFSIFAAVNGMRGLLRLYKLNWIQAFFAEFIIPSAVYVAFGIFVVLYGTELGIV